MGSSGGILRGTLRPGAGRTPPLLLIFLVVFLGILGFNYWNLSAEYSDLLRRMADLQDKLRIAGMKRENGEQQISEMQLRMREAEEEMGQVKMLYQQKIQESNGLNKLIDRRNEHIVNLKDNITRCVLSMKEMRQASSGISDLQKKVEDLLAEKEELFLNNKRMKSNMASLQAENAGLQSSFNRAKPQSHIKTAKPKVAQPGGSLPYIDRTAVRIKPVGMVGISWHGDGPIVRAR